MRLREITKMRTANDGTRTLFESTMMPELTAALRDWQRAHTKGVLIGGLALSYHVRPRMTQDLDFLFLSSSDIPEKVPGFRRTRPHAFQHNKTHVEIELVTPDFVNVPREVAQKVFDTATVSNGIRVASATGLVALKLYRLSFQDKADIVALINSGLVSDLSEFGLPSDKMVSFEKLAAEAQDDPHPC